MFVSSRRNRALSEAAGNTVLIDRLVPCILHGDFVHPPVFASINRKTDLAYLSVVAHGRSIHGYSGMMFMETNRSVTFDGNLTSCIRERDLAVRHPLDEHIQSIRVNMVVQHGELRRVAVGGIRHSLDKSLGYSSPLPCHTSQKKRMVYKLMPDIDSRNNEEDYDRINCHTGALHRPI